MKLLSTYQTHGFLLVFLLLMLPDIALSASLHLTWKPNSESDLSFYSVYCGTSSRAYGNPIPVGKVTSYNVEGLQAERKYFCAVTATDTSGNESGFSSEVSATVALPKSETEPYRILVSTTPNRSNAVDLNNQTIEKNVYIFVKPENNIKNINFYVDGKFVKTENDAPFDLAGSRVDSAYPFKTENIANYHHHFRAKITLHDNSTQTISAVATVSNSLPKVTAQGSVSGKKFIDFNGDGHTDILWRNYKDGKNVIWYMNNTKLIGKADLLRVKDLNWTIGGAGDFNRDGYPDILWRHKKRGENQVWYMKGAKFIGNDYLLRVKDLNWEIGGTGDFNRDGSIDIFWRHKKSGENQVWYMKGAKWIGNDYLPQEKDLDWKMAGIGDLNDDHSVDILWRHSTTGKNRVWSLNKTKMAGQVYLPTAKDLGWEVAGISDFNNDGHTDILWHHNLRGENQIWRMNGVELIKGGNYISKESDLYWASNAK